MRHKLSTPPRPPTVSELRWRDQAPRLRVAAVPHGSYVLTADALYFWTAQWRPAGKGRPEFLLLRTTKDLAERACGRHYLESQSDTLLARDGALDLTDPSTKGAATTWKHRR